VLFTRKVDAAASTLYAHTAPSRGSATAYDSLWPQEPAHPPPDEPKFYLNFILSFAY